jgi:hypothetical protein
MASAAKPSDPLLKTVEEIIGRAKSDGFVIFYGWAHGSKENTIYWNEEHGGDWNKFLGSAKALGAKVVYLNWAPFEEFQVDEAIAEGSSEATDDRELEASAEIEEQKKQIEKYCDKVGLTSIIDLAFVLDGVFHIYQLAADWFRAFEELTAGKEEAEEGEPVEEPLDKVLVNKWAEALANHAKFGICKNYEQREYLLEKLAAEEYERLPLGYILRRAETLYLFEVRPKEEERLRAQAGELRKQGLNINAIALKLGIPRDRVSGLLAD